MLERSVAPLHEGRDAPRIEDAVRHELTAIRSEFDSGNVLDGMRILSSALNRFRAAAGAADWPALAGDAVLKHDISEVIWTCPLTSRSFSKPRGYAGDAELLDHIYGLGAANLAPHPATLGGRIYFYTVNTPACQAVRRRREIIAAEIDRCAARTGAGRANLLSIACGHLREALLSHALNERAIARFVAVDQDEDSLSEIARCYAGLGVETMKGSVRNIIGRKLVFADMDLVYAAGLFDYLIEPVAMRLIERMFSFLRPGGRLLIANFTPVVPDIGYMETFMDWKLIFRTGEELRALFKPLAERENLLVDIFEDEAGVIAYAAVEKRS